MLWRASGRYDRCWIPTRTSIDELCVSLVSKADKLALIHDSAKNTAREISCFHRYAVDQCGAVYALKIGIKILPKKT